MFLIAHFDVNTKSAKSAWRLGVTFAKILPSAHVYLRSAAHVFTTSGICGVFTITLIWIVQNYLQMFLRLAVLDYCTSLLSCVVDIDLTKLNYVLPGLYFLVGGNLQLLLYSAESIEAVTW